MRTLFINIRRKIRAALKGEFLIFLFFVVVSACLWMMFELRKQQTTTIYFKVEYINVPNEFVITNKLPKVINVKVKDIGFNLIMNKLFYDSLYVSFNLKDHFNSKKTSFLLTYAGISQQVALKLNSSAQIKNIYPRDIVVRYEKMYFKQLPVKLKFELYMSPQYMIQGREVIKPSFVKAYGSKFVLENLKEVNTQKIYRKNISSKIKIKARLENIKGIKLEPSFVDVFIPVEQFTEKTLYLPISLKSESNNHRVCIFPAMVKVSFIVGMSHFESITNKDFNAYVDCSQINSFGKQKLDVNVNVRSIYVSRILLTPNKVDYIIEDK